MYGKYSGMPTRQNGRGLSRKSTCCATTVRNVGGGRVRLQCGTRAGKRPYDYGAERREESDVGVSETAGNETARSNEKVAITFPGLNLSGGSMFPRAQCHGNR